MRYLKITFLTANLLITTSVSAKDYGFFDIPYNPIFTTVNLDARALTVNGGLSVPTKIPLLYLYGYGGIGFSSTTFFELPVGLGILYDLPVIAPYFSVHTNLTAGLFTDPFFDANPIYGQSGFKAGARFKLDHDNSFISLYFRQDHFNAASPYVTNTIGINFGMTEKPGW